MKTSNLALRYAPDIAPGPIAPARPEPVPRSEPPRPGRPRPRLDRRVIEIRDQGFAPFRVR